MKVANGDYFIYCVSLTYSRHLSSLRQSKLNLSCITGVCLCHPSSLLPVLTSSVASYEAKTHPCTDSTKYCQHVPRKGRGRTGRNQFCTCFLVSFSADQSASTTLLGYLCALGEEFSTIAFQIIWEAGNITALLKDALLRALANCRCFITFHCTITFRFSVTRGIFEAALSCSFLR